MYDGGPVGLGGIQQLFGDDSDMSDAFTCPGVLLMAAEVWFHLNLLRSKQIWSLVSSKSHFQP